MFIRVFLPDMGRKLIVLFSCLDYQSEIFEF